MKILIVKTSSLGDIIHAFPALAYLRDTFPGVQIDWAVEEPFSEILEAHPYVDNVIAIQTRIWRKALWCRETWREVGRCIKKMRRNCYDIVFDLQGNTKSGIITLLSGGKSRVGFALKDVAEWPNVFSTNRRYALVEKQNIRDDYLSVIKKYFCDDVPFDDDKIVLDITTEQHHALRKYSSGDYNVMVCPGSAWKNKRVTEECLSDFLSMITVEYRPYFIFIWGNDVERVFVERLHRKFLGNSVVAEKLSLPILQNLMGMVQLVVAMDSLALHLCATTTTPTFSVFGASESDKYKPPGAEHYALQGTCPYGKTFIKRCPQLRTCQTGGCIRNITGRTMYESWRNQ